MAQDSVIIQRVPLHVLGVLQTTCRHLPLQNFMAVLRRYDACWRLWWALTRVDHGAACGLLPVLWLVR